MIPYNFEIVDSTFKQMVPTQQATVQRQKPNQQEECGLYSACNDHISDQSKVANKANKFL
jgi:hypothetical protein